jgi:hypothetical protein
LGASPFFGFDTTISGNSEGGLRLMQMSMAWLSSGSMIFNNGGRDATCDPTSYLFGDASGIAVNKCRTVSVSR